MLPQALQTALDRLTAGTDAGTLLREARTLSEAYRTRTGAGERLAATSEAAAAYAASRMPATYEAVRAALTEALRASGLRPETLLDCGAGTGAATWAADGLLALRAAVCAEREAAMRDAGQRLMREGGWTPGRAEWLNADAAAGEPLPRAQLVIEGYMLGELAPPSREAAALRLWDAAEQMLLLVEPGTPAGFEHLARVREALAARGAYVAAPCPRGARGCRLAEGDWCHFAVRLPRTRLHKALKGGDAPFEDEKFAYLALTRAKPSAPCEARVLRHPQIAPGRIELTLCTPQGVKRCAVTKKDPLWKRARKLGAGDGL